MAPYRFHITIPIIIIRTVVFAQTACQVRQTRDHSVLYSAAKIKRVLHNQNTNYLYIIISLL